MPERTGMLSRRRLHAQRQLVHTADIRRATETESPLEGEPDIKTYQDHLLDEPCYYYTVGGSEGRLEYGSVISRRRAKLQFAYGTDVGEGDIIQLVLDEFGIPKNAQPIAIDSVTDLHTHIEVETTEIGRV